MTEQPDANLPLDLDRGRRDRQERGGRVFDVQPVVDRRREGYPISAVLPQATAPVKRLWRAGQVLDQGVEGACVGHGWTGFLASSPKRVTFDRNQPPAPTDAQGFAFWLYHEAQKVDPWPGEDYDGTSIDAAAAVLKGLGYIEGYRWIKTRAELATTLQTVGPVIVAIPWHAGMYTAPKGRLRIAGEQVGWHCLLVNGYDPARRFSRWTKRVEAVRLLNSWGPDWGVGGQAWVGLDELWPLLSDDGSDLCVPLGERFLPQVGTLVAPADIEA